MKYLLGIHTLFAGLTGLAVLQAWLSLIFKGQINQKNIEKLLNTGLVLSLLSGVALSAVSKAGTLHACVNITAYMTVVTGTLISLKVSKKAPGVLDILTRHSVLLLGSILIILSLN